ncbi:hypothetical protein LAZ40_06780 [Cereibacter sphaeroides]|uniref:hypothetical protein n=1 Tax=Cereibacter sphaeroides TaxID=1063 RepID=UPI001F38EB70|nr:hypothetical protein [Cereibacter sphaeroides]MCE6958751.1 hypothetical protein [Cereibacter sphaeroides]MCE6973375.1 hypothetical protein [Cereibacter sphaeroides]
MKTLLASIAAVLAAFPAAAYIGPLDITAFGHEVEVVMVQGRNGEVMELRVDGQALYSDVRVLIEQVAVVGGTPVLVGSASAGGNVCADSPFVVSLEPGKPALFDGPVDDCTWPRTEIGDAEIRFIAEAHPTRPGHVWRWTPGGGIETVEELAAKPDPARGWEALREHRIAHPSDIFTYGPLAEAATALLGDDRETFLEIAGGPGSGTWHGESWTGTSCQAHMCGWTGSFVHLDVPNRKIYLAWKRAQGSVEMRPAQGDWPKQVLSRETDWAATLSNLP